jgi:hypothetical protein
LAVFGLADKPFSVADQRAERYAECVGERDQLIEVRIDLPGFDAANTPRRHFASSRQPAPLREVVHAQAAPLTQVAYSLPERHQLLLATSAASRGTPLVSVAAHADRDVAV